MLWRKFKLDWHYAIGELIIVTVGVLIALAIQQWNDDRLEQVEEKEILEHLLIDLQEDSTRLDDMVEAVMEKEASLARLQSVFDSGQAPRDPHQFLQDVVVGANYGWNQAYPRGSTFQEILSSGKFGLIRNAELRSAIADYHSLFQDLYVRADARETQFPHISYQLMPRARESERKGVLLSPETSLSHEDVGRLVDRTLSSSLRDYVVAETNLARFILRVAMDVRTEHEALVDRITGYQSLLEN